MNRHSCLTAIVLLAVAGTAWAQLPPDAVQLDKVKISEKQKSDQLCPVHLVDADASLPAWTYEGVSYRGHTPLSSEGRHGGRLW